MLEVDIRSTNHRNKISGIDYKKLSVHIFLSFSHYAAHVPPNSYVRVLFLPQLPE
jgi:hypothetical protein